MDKVNLRNYGQALEYIAKNAVDPDDLARIKGTYGITDAAIEDKKRSMVKTKSSVENWSDSKRNREVVKLQENAKRREESVNRKIDRYIDRYYGNDDIIKSITEQLYKDMTVTYQESGKGMKMTDKIFEDLINNKVSAMAGAINKNRRMSPEALKKQMRVDLDIENETDVYKLRKINRELHDMEKQSSLVVKQTNSGYVMQKEMIENRDVIIPLATERQEDRQSKVKELVDKMDGEIHFIETKMNFGFEDVKGYERQLTARQAIAKRASDNYHRDRAEITRANYLAAAEKEYSSSDFEDIRNEVNKMSDLEFEAFFVSHGSGSITFIYGAGKNFPGKVLGDLRAANNKLGN